MACFRQKKNSVMESLPTDLLLQVFSRLPCKDVVICKCVCKVWYNILSHPDFSKHYAKNSPFTSIFLLKHFSLDETSYAFLLEIAGDGGLIKTPLTTNIPNFYLNPRQSAIELCYSNIIGSCNGLFFFSQSRRALGNNCDVFQGVYCYHPFSGECVLLAARKWAVGMLNVQYRVGHISSSGNIKLLAFVNNEQPACILTVGIDRRWRKLEDCLDHHYWFYGVSFDGVYHWIYPANCTHLKTLKTFDFRKEKIGPEWELPGDLVQDTREIHLEVLNNGISVIKNLSNLDMVIWTMEEYGVAESWSKKTVIAGYRVSYLQASLTNGDLLFSDDHGHGFTFVNLEKGDTKFDIYKSEIMSGALHAAEFAPKFCSLNHCWNIQNI